MAIHQLDNSSYSVKAEEQPTIKQAFMDSIRRLVSLLHVASRATEKKLGLSAAQLFVLEKLADGQARSMNELAKLTHTHQSSVSTVVRRLIEKKMITSRAADDDARRHELRITSLGCGVLEQSPEMVQDRLLNAFESISPKDRAELIRLLTLLLDQAQVADGPAPLFFED